MARDRRVAERSGRTAEAFAAFFLRLKGYSLVERRYRTPVGEVDLILRRGGTLVFVEVKRRASRDEALLSVAPAARRRILRAAEWYISSHPAAAGLTFRFDVVALAPGRLPYHLVDAFGVDR